MEQEQAQSAAVRRIIIREPYWIKRAFGVSAREFIQNPVVQVECEYREPRTGLKSFPHVYEISREEAEAYEIQFVRNHPLRVIPITAFRIVKHQEVK